jgi:hypothetical protein
MQAVWITVVPLPFGPDSIDRVKPSTPAGRRRNCRLEVVKGGRRVLKVANK